MYYFSRQDFSNDHYYDFSDKDITVDDIKQFFRYHRQGIGVNIYEFGVDNSRFDLININMSQKKEIIVYEFKTSRNDFVNDNKWQGYLQYCNRLIFISPFGVINKGDLPKGIGLIHIWKWKHKTGTEFKRVCGNRIMIPKRKDLSHGNYVKVLENFIRKMPYRKQELF